MTDLEKILAENTPPAPRSALTENILSAAQNLAPANDGPAQRPWWAIGGIAVMAVAALLFTQPFSQTDVETDTEILAEAEWADVAETVGFADLYAWVEDVPAEEGS